MAFLTIAYRFTQLEATKFAPVALVLAVKRTSILYASFFGGKIFSDERLAQKLIGGALIVGAGFIILQKRWIDFNAERLKDSPVQFITSVLHES